MRRIILTYFLLDCGKNYCCRTLKIGLDVLKWYMYILPLPRFVAFAIITHYELRIIFRLTFSENWFIIILYIYAPKMK